MRAGGSVRKGMRKSAFKGLNISKVFEQWANDKETNL